MRAGARAGRMERRSSPVRGPARSASKPDHAAVLQLQHAAGNSAVASLLRSGGPTVQRHSSFEHRMLGDIPPDRLQAMAHANEANDAGIRTPQGNVAIESAHHTIDQELRRLVAWQASPPTAAGEWGAIDTTWNVRLVAIRSTSVPEKPPTVVTYGELNAMADFFGNVDQMRAAEPATVLKLANFVRQQSIDRLQETRKKLPPPPPPEKTFWDSVSGAAESAWGVIRHPLDTAAAAYGAVAGQVTPTSGNSADVYTQAVMAGDAFLKPSQRYLSNVARNACHFAPQSWYRWRDHHDKAFADGQKAFQHGQEARAANDPARQRAAADAANEALVTNGFGDHYLQDSFAAGHLINKTLIMQWFIDWLDRTNAATNWLIPRWSEIRRMGSFEQQGLAGREKYRSGAGTDPLRDRSVHANDPQSAEERGSFADRYRASGLRSAPGGERAAKAAYAAMLRSAFIQKGAGDLHNHFCKEGLVVSSKSGVGTFKIYGDDAMMTGGEGVGISAETSEMSRNRIVDSVTKGSSAITAEAIMDRLPSSVSNGGAQSTLEKWATGDTLRAQCEKDIFPKVTAAAMPADLTVGAGVSLDEEPDLQRVARGVAEAAELVSPFGDSGVF